MFHEDMSQFLFHDEISRLMKMALNSELKTPCLAKRQSEYSKVELAVIKTEAIRAGIDNVVFPEGQKAIQISTSNL